MNLSTFVVSFRGMPVAYHDKKRVDLQAQIATRINKIAWNVYRFFYRIMFDLLICVTLINVSVAGYITSLACNVASCTRNLVPRVLSLLWESTLGAAGNVSTRF